MKRLCLSLLLAGAMAAQTDAPPALDTPSAPDELPSVGAGPDEVKGTLDLVFSGVRAFRETRLREEIAFQMESMERFGLDEPGAYDAAFFLESFYRRNGYAGAEVAGVIEGPWRLRLRVNEGPLVTVGKIRFRGNAGYDDATLREYLLGPIREENPRRRRDGDLPYSAAGIDAGVDLVRRLYASGGYLDAEVDPPEISRRNGVADVVLTIREGRAYRFGRMRFGGGGDLAEADLRAVVAGQTGGVYTPGRLDAARRAVEDLLVRRGHYQATVSADADLSGTVDGAVPVVFLLEPGPVFRFDGVTVSGTSGVKPEFLRNRLRHLQGKTYSPEAVERSFRELIQTGLFRDLRLAPEAVSDNEVRLDVTVVEAKPKEFAVGIGYATFEGGIVSASYRDLNFLRRGRPLRLEAEVNQRGIGGEVLYTDPWLFETNNELRLRLYGLNARLKGYSKNEFGFQPTLTRAVTEHWKVSAFLWARHVSVVDVEIEPTSLVGKQNYSIFALGLSQTLDYRNNPALPTRGFVFSTAVDLAPAGLGGVSYIRGTGRFSYYIPITQQTTLALGVCAGVIASLGSEGLPVDERFFNGGATTVRSFSELALGPKDRQGYPLGGGGFTVFNAEHTFPILGDLHGAVFVDAGNVAVEAREFGLENMRYGVGAGLRYHLPIGAVRLDYGWNPSPRAGEAQGAFHFAIGVAF